METQPDHNDSDNDQGFVVNNIEIKQKDKNTILVNSLSRPIDYQPRYVASHHMIKKQLPELMLSYPHFANDEQTYSPKTSHKKRRESISKVEQHSFPNKNYQLIYQRYNKGSYNEPLKTENNLDLKSVINYAAQNYSVLKPWDLNIDTGDLAFQSRFQCGNLLSAYKSLTTQNHYILFLQNDTNSNGYNKWFYFAVKNKKKMSNCTFSIVNYRKNLSFIKQGMKPTRFSLRTQESKGNGWTRCGNKVAMYPSKISQDSLFNYQGHYTLTFEVCFQYENDTNFFSLIPPYSYTKLTHFLAESQKKTNIEKDINFEYKTISYSLSNTQVPYVTISAPIPSKKNIIVLARQHPGQVWSSFAVQSLINQLLRDQFPQKTWLLQNYTFRIFPMINIDGVIYGNFRCDLSGTDINRCWKEPNKLLHPHIIAIKEEIRRLTSQEEIVSCFDFHSHSKDYNIFAYCCKTDNHGRILPLLISKMTPTFYFPYCTFGISKYKQTTARAVIYQISKAPDVLTIESSFYAINNPMKALTPSTFITFTNSLIKSMKHYLSKDREYVEAEKDLPRAMAEVAALRSKNRQKWSKQEQSGSDSQPEVDQIALADKIGKIIPKCNAVQEAFGLKVQQKDKESVIVKKKKSVSPVKLKNKEPRPQPKELKALRNTISEQPSSRKVEKPPLLMTRPKINNSSDNSFLDRLYKRKDKSTLQPKQHKTERFRNSKFQIKEKNESVQLQPRKSITLNKFAVCDFKSTYRQKQLKYQIEQVQQKRQEQFPLLCVLSDSKRQAHLQKLKRIHPSPSKRDKPVIRYQPTFVVNKKIETMQRLRQRQKKSSDLVSSLWKDTLGYDQDGPVTHIFYGIP